ncbi:MAG: MFS transporter [Clostridium sp.]|uniref:MDR family MFS transporter n=1 Tax=Clostridium sp. TaxID=1506 RepID=UPI0025BFB4F7|nr:MDR family MFS transporter [Clostridium sp.]MCH3963170.1 MFS transporter [Clostridium sp.]MCI1716367.1 MFS transporter [Clostridium sp.]MCI1800707.1 MFS transporter [Clostridium sp.]MCI1814638.1 MFS transporter [Clostridium sp.]MCI1871548.1 MFS transporter [Clostridium sp.]
MKTSRRGIIAAVMVAMVLAAVENTVVTVAVPTIVKDLNGFQSVSWVFSLYLLTASITTPIYGKLADLYGRKDTLSIGIGIFLIGSFLCGLSTNMYELMVFRAIQGSGAGAIYTVTYTIIGDQFSVFERAKVQGWLSSAWGISSLIGPFVGGTLIDALSWHWIFFINMPFGIISIVLLQKSIVENFERKKAAVDYCGIIFLTSAIVALLMVFMTDDKNYGIELSRIIACVTIFTVSSVMFYRAEKKAEEPIMPFEIFRGSNITINTISFISSAVLIGIGVYMSIYVQNVLGYNAAVAGLSMSPMSVTWFLVTFFLGDKIGKYGEKAIVVFSSFIIIMGTACLLTLGINSSLLLVMSFSAILGIGFGLNFTILTIAIQESVNYDMKGAATASNALIRNLGQTIGISIFGSIFNFSIVENSLNSGIHSVFLVMCALDAIVLVISFTLSSALKKL